MSREERRQRERMMKNMDRGATLPPAARARAERNASRRAARGAPAGGRAFTPRFMLVSLLVALALGYLAFSIQFQESNAALVGAAVGLITLLALVGMRLLQRRAASPRP